jgi:pimeloyl-ACP methyl ester carboxylesterase
MKPENLKSILYKNINLFYSDYGQGAPIVLLHGYLENQSMWHFYITPLTKKNRVITIDLLGHGKTQCLGYVHTMEDQAAMINFVLKALNIEKASFVGHSMGGYVALAFAEIYPNKTSSLVLLNSTAYSDNLEKKANRDRAIKAVKIDYTTCVSLSIANLFSEKNRDLLIPEIEAVKKEALKTPLQGIIAAQEGMKIRDARVAVLQQATLPILLILGKNDPVLNYEEHAKQVLETNVKLVTLPDGHMSHIENKNELEKILLNFFDTKK